MGPGYSPQGCSTIVQCFVIFVQWTQLEQVKDFMDISARRDLEIVRVCTQVAEGCQDGEESEGPEGEEQLNFKTADISRRFCSEDFGDVGRREEKDKAVQQRESYSCS